jgi:hypothetical protein
MRSNQALSRLLAVLSSLLVGLPSSQAFTPIASERSFASQTRTALLNSAPLHSAAATPSQMMTQMPLVLPLFIQDRQFTSTLVMVNGSNEVTAADVTLTALNGREIKTERVDFAPHSQRRIEIYSLLQAAVSPDTSGRITIMPSSGVKNMAVLAQLSLTYLGSREPTYLDEEIAMPSPEGSQTLRAVADPGQGSPVVAITSLSASPQNITVQCLRPRGAPFSKSVELGTAETVVMQACADGTLHDVAFQEVSGTTSEEARGAIGIALRSDAMPGSFAAFGLAAHKAEGNRFFSAVSFTDPKLLRSPNTVFTGVPIGSAFLFPDANFEPEVALANFSAKDLNVTVKYSRTSGGEPLLQDVTKLVIPAGATQHISLSGLQADPDLKNSFLITSNGAPGDLIAKLFATSESGLHEVELLGKDQEDYLDGGDHPWSTEQGTESTLLLFNDSAKPQKLDVQIGAGNALWQKNYVLKPMETMSLAVGDIIEKQIIDDKGKKLPKDIQNGHIQWFNLNSGGSHGRLLQSNRATDMARSFSCGQFYIICSSSFYIEVGNLLISATQEVASLTVTVCSNPYSPTCYTGSPAYYDPGSPNWSSSNSSVANITGYGSGGYAVDLKGDAGGSTTVSASIVDQYGCSGGGSGSVKVQVPTSLSVVSGVLASSGQCSSSQYGAMADITYQVRDQNAAQIQASGMQPQEIITNFFINGVHQPDPAPNWANLGNPSDSTGRFHDTPLGVCAGFAVTETATQQISVVYNGNRYPASGALKTNSLRFTGLTVGHGRVCNGTDSNCTGADFNVSR